MELDKYQMVLLNIIGTYNEGKGVSIPTIDRIFYTKLSEDSELKDIYNIQWISILDFLTEKQFIEKVPSGKGERITEKGRDVLKSYI